MKTIHKHHLMYQEEQHVTTHKGAEFISTDFQGSAIVIYALVDTDMPVEKRKIFVVGTGNPIKVDLSEYDFIGTANQQSGRFMWHVFAEKKEKV